MELWSYGWEGPETQHSNAPLPTLHWLVVCIAEFMTGVGEVRSNEVFIS